MRQSPQFESAPSQVLEHFSTEETNGLQMELMKHSEYDAVTWIQTYAESFRTLIENEPKLFDLYKENPERCLEIIAEKLHARMLH